MNEMPVKPMDDASLDVVRSTLAVVLPRKSKHPVISNQDLATLVARLDRAEQACRDWCETTDTIGAQYDALQAIVERMGVWIGCEAQHGTNCRLNDPDIFDRPRKERVCTCGLNALDDLLASRAATNAGIQPDHPSYEELLESHTNLLRLCKQYEPDAVFPVAESVHRRCHAETQPATIEQHDHEHEVAELRIELEAERNTRQELEAELSRLESSIAAHVDVAKPEDPT